jgi:hypothetical protein
MVPGGLPWLKSRSLSRKRARRPRRSVSQGRICEWLLEERCMLAVDIPIPASHPVVPLSTIFWNGEPAPLNPAGKPNIPAPDKVGAAKTITLTNNSSDTIYPFLRGENGGEDPNSTTGKLYDPQDLVKREFRQYVGYSKQDGSRYLGLPKGASITIQVPLALWDGNNLYIATDGTNLTTAEPNIFNYETTAKITVAQTDPVSGSIWVQASSNFPQGQNPLVMFYFVDGKPKTVPDDAPAQLTEITFRDPYLTQFITDPKQTFPLLNYDVSYVNNLVAPVSMAASHVPITYGDTESKTVPPTYYGYEDFGWLATDRDTAAFENAIKDFVKNTGEAGIGTYFGPQEQGWPAYYGPASGSTVIPSGANLFDDSPLTVDASIAHPSSYDSNRWMLTSNGTGPIAARAGGVALEDPRATRLPLSLTAEQKVDFIKTIKEMMANGGQVNLTLSSGPAVLGQVTDYDPGDSIIAFRVTNQGSGYTKAPQVVVSGGGGQGAEGIAFVENGKVVAVGIVTNKAGSGYVSPPKVEFVGGGGKGAEAVADVGGGKVKVRLNEGVNLPTHKDLSYVFARPSKDYAVTAITNLWYSWAQYYVQQYQNFADVKVSATLNRKPIPGSEDKTLRITNEITLAADPPVPLAVGMTVQGVGIPAGTTILKVVGRQIYLSQVPTRDVPATQDYTFGKPTMLRYNPAFTNPYKLEFGPAEATKARLFAGSVYSALATQAVELPASKLLPYSANLVAHVIKFWAKIPSYDKPWGPILVGEVRDVVKSILRGVHDFEAVPDQTQWYPEPGKPAGGRDFNVYNLDPYVWFVHEVQKMSAYGFSVDDDVSNPTATGPLLSADKSGNHFPNNLRISFGGVGGLGNDKQWFPTTPWGSIETTATISVVPSGDWAGYSMVTFTGPDALKIYNQINNPGAGQVGAYIIAPGFIVPGTTLIHKGPISGDVPQIVLSQKAISTDTPITVKVDAATFAIPTVPLKNASFATPAQNSPPFYVVAPTGPNVAWAFGGTAGIAAKNSLYTKNNPAPVGAQVAFIQNTGSISQSVALKPNRAYAVSFLVAQRRLDNGSVNAQTLQVRIGQNVIGNFASKTAGDSRYVLFTSDAFTVPSAGDYTLVIAGTNHSGGDNTALIDQVMLTGDNAASLATLGLGSPQAQFVQNVYDNVLDRPARLAEQRGWVQFLKSGGSRRRMTLALVTSPAYRRRHTSAEAFVAGLFRDILGRQPDATELASWLSLARARRGNRIALARSFLSTPEARESLRELFQQS